MNRRRRSRRVKKLHRAEGEGKSLREFAQSVVSNDTVLQPLDNELVSAWWHHKRNPPKAVHRPRIPKAKPEKAKQGKRK